MKKSILLAFCLLAAINMNSQPTQAPQVYEVGGYKVYILTEHQGETGTNILIDAPKDVTDKYVPTGKFPNAVHAILIVKEGEVWLADTGFGRNIFGQMASVGILPKNVDHIILTHMHGDHIGGMLLDGKPAFPNADVIVSAEESRYWTSETEMMKMPENRRGNFKLAQDVLQVYGNKVKIEEPFGLGDKMGDGIHMLAAYGHTPGHVIYLIRDGQDELLIWGDLTHAMAVQMPHPEISVTYDVDPVMARKSRIDVLKYVSENGIQVAGMHIPFSGTGMVQKDNDSAGYVFNYYNSVNEE